MILKLNIDGLINIEELTDSLLDELALLEPFGHQNDSPVFILKNVINHKEPYLMKGLHVKCFIRSLENSEKVIPLVFFNRPDLWDIIQTKDFFNVVVKISENYWNDKRTLELIGIDINFN